MTISKRVFSIIALVLFVVFVCPLYLLPVSAANNEMTFQLDIGTPSISDNNGYIELLFHNDSNDEYFVRTYTWSTNPIGSNVNQTYCEISFGDNFVTLAPGFHIIDTEGIDLNSCGARLNYFWVSSSGYTSTGAINQYYGRANSVTISADNCTLLGAHVYGNYRLLTGITSRNEFSVIYSNDSTSFNLLFDILDTLYSIKDLDSHIIVRLDDIILSNNSIDDKLTDVLDVLGSIDTGIDSVNKKLDTIISNTDDIETKLDKIIDILESNLDTEVPTEVPKDSLNEHNNLESDIVGGITSNDFGFNIDNFNYDTEFLQGDSFNLAWSLIGMAFSTHDMILFTVILVLILGFIALILNR